MFYTFFICVKREHIYFATNLHCIFTMIKKSIYFFTGVLLTLCVILF
jgi:hypothetical protein